MPQPSRMLSRDTEAAAPGVPSLPGALGTPTGQGELQTRLDTALRRAQEGTCTMDSSLLRAHTRPTRWALAWEMRDSSETLMKTIL